MNLNQMCEDAHALAKEKGFCSGKRPIPELLMLVVTELGEACEADRKGDESNFREELADTFIRLGDMCSELEIDIEAEIIKKMKKNKTRPKKHGKRY